MSLSDSAVLEALDAAGNGLRATFFRRVDRYAHRIERIEGDGAAWLLLESIEGSDLDRWPPSPPLQQLSLEQLPDGRPVALLVGMAGASHWSLTAEREPGVASLVFDVACRLKEPGAALGSAYRSHVRHELVADAVQLHRPGGMGRPATVERLPIAPAAGPIPQLQVDGRGLSLSFAEAPPNQTVRWKYRIALANDRSP